MPTAWYLSSRRTPASGRVLMVAWANRDALAETARDAASGVLVALARPALAQGRGVGPYAARSSEIRLDCDGDVVLYAVEQAGGIACHTGRQSCFFRRLTDGQWETVDPVLQDPELIYRK